jgi:hypothetical protein
VNGETGSGTVVRRPRLSQKTIKSFPITIVRVATTRAVRIQEYGLISF